MTRTTFPEVPPGRDITDEAARAAALLVRDWYEQGEQGTIETDSIVTVARWAIHRTGVASKAVEPRLTDAETQRSSSGARSDDLDAEYERGRKAGITQIYDSMRDQGIESPPPEGEPDSTSEHQPERAGKRPEAAIQDLRDRP